MLIDQILQKIRDEVSRQDAKFGEQNHPDGTGSAFQKDLATAARNSCQSKAQDGQHTWADILTEEFAEALAESDPDKIDEELIQVAAVCVNWSLCQARKRAAAETPA